MKFRTIYLDPPWSLNLIGKFSGRHKRPDGMPYECLSLDAIRSLPIPDLADTNSHLWLFTTNQTLRAGFDLMEYWGFKYMIPVHWVKPSGFGAWFVNRTQTLLFGYRGKLDMKPNGRYKPNVIFAPSTRHSAKPLQTYELIEAVSHEPYLELFARAKRENWSVWGNELPNDINISLAS